MRGMNIFEERKVRLLKHCDFHLGSFMALSFSISHSSALSWEIGEFHMARSWDLPAKSRISLDAAEV